MRIGAGWYNSNHSTCWIASVAVELTMHGYDLSDPIAANDTTEGRADNDGAELDGSQPPAEISQPPTPTDQQTNLFATVQCSYHAPYRYSGGAARRESE